MTKEVTTNTERKNECYVTPAADIYETGNEYTLKLEMPGVEKDGLDIILHDEELEIIGKANDMKYDGMERKYGEFTIYDYKRVFRIGNDVDRNKIDAKLENGVLSLSLQKKEDVKPRKIEVQVH